MSETPIAFGQVGWIDLTVPEADRIRDFYGKVIGWTWQPVKMGDYDDFNMLGPDGRPAAGVCFKKGVNAQIPSQWLIYITVPDIDSSVAACIELGGKVLVGPKGMGSMGKFCVIADPAGAVCALYEPAKD